MNEVIGPDTLSKNEAVSFSESSEEVRSWVRYPEAFPQRLENAFAAQHDLPTHCVLATSGASGALAQVFHSWVRPGDVVAFPLPSFPLYQALVKWAHAVPLPISFQANWDYCSTQLFKPEVLRARLIILCAPNNPTGVLLSSDLLQNLASRTSAIIVVDEAYAEFACEAPGTDAVRLGMPNVVAVRSLSKAWGAAGLRIGAAFAAATLTAQLRKGALPFAIPQASVDSALRLFAGEAEIGRRIAYTLRERERVQNALLKFGCCVPPSSGNFVCIVEHSVTTKVTKALTEHFSHRVSTQTLPDGRVLLRLTIGAEHQSNEALRLVEAARGSKSINRVLRDAVS